MSLKKYVVIAFVVVFSLFISASLGYASAQPGFNQDNNLYLEGV